MEGNKELLEATRLVLDLKLEKKQYNSEMNKKIRDAEDVIRQLVNENPNQGKLL